MLSGKFGEPMTKIVRGWFAVGYLNGKSPGEYFMLLYYEVFISSLNKCTVICGSKILKLSYST